MSQYSKVLVAIDATEEAEVLLQKAVQLGSAELNLVHAIEPLSYAYGGDLPIDFSSLQAEMQQQAAQHMNTLAARFGIPQAQCHIVVGRPSDEIHRLAKVLEADLIIVGSHGRHGLSLLLGSTANGVLHGATCDVLAVRIGQASA